MKSVLIVVGNIEHNQTEIVKAIVNTLADNLDDLTVVDTFKSKKLKNLFDGITEKVKSIEDKGARKQILDLIKSTSSYEKVTSKDKVAKYWSKLQSKYEKQDRE
jgi:hypothetical protein